MGGGKVGFQSSIIALALLDHVVPALPLRHGEDVGSAGDDIRCKAEIVGVIGDDEEVERTAEPDRLPARGDHLLALGKAVSLGRPQSRAEHSGVERDRGVQVRVAEERAFRKRSVCIGRVRALFHHPFQTLWRNGPDVAVLGECRRG